MGSDISRDSEDLIKQPQGWYTCKDFWEHFERLKFLGSGRTCEVILLSEIKHLIKKMSLCFFR